METFLSECWRRDVLYVSRQGTRAFDDIMAVEEIGRHLASYTLPASFLRVVTDGVDRSSREWAASRRAGADAVTTADPARLMSFFASGATIVINEAGRTFAGLIRLCVALEEELETAVQANIYITPPSRAGLAPHIDGHDVLALQIHGSKRWRLYGRLDGDAAKAGRTLDRTELHGRDVREIEMRAGDLLYLPRHQIHEAATTDEPSIHVTIGFPPPKLADIVRGLLGRRLDEPIAIEAGETGAGMHDRLAREITAALSRRPGAADRDTLDLGTWFADVMNARGLSRDSRVMRRAGTHTRVETRGGGSAIVVGAKTHDLQAPLDALAINLLTETPTRIGDACGAWPEEMAVQVARTLIAMGALEVTAL